MSAHSVFTLLLCFFLTQFAHAQNATDTIDKILLPDNPDTADFLTFSFLFTPGKVGGVLRNITAELMSGKAEDNGQDVVDIIWNHGHDQGFEDSDFGYQTHAATPAGSYHIRLNGTVYDTLASEIGTPGASITNRSATFTLAPKPDAFLCTTPASFTPVPNTAAPGYSPLRLNQPNGGTVYYLTIPPQDPNSDEPQTPEGADIITVAPYFIDESFTYESPAVPTMSLELVESGSGKSAGSVVVNQTSAAYQSVNVHQYPGITPGAYKVRATFTSTVYPNQNFTSLSDEIYIAASPNCTGLQAGNSTTTAGGSSTSGKTGGGVNLKQVGSLSATVASAVFVVWGLVVANML